jgi:DNA-binding PadR family transcriptional regulator
MSQLTPDEVLLGLLAAQAGHGYQLLEHFRDPAKLGQVWDLSTSQLYAVLKRLEQQQQIAGQAVESSDAPTRTEYHLTEGGQARFEAWLHEKSPSSSVRRVRVEFLSRLYVARLLNIPTFSIVRSQKIACADAYQELLTQREKVGPGVGYLALELQIAQLGAILQWIDRCELVPLYSEDTK